MNQEEKLQQIMLVLLNIVKEDREKQATEHEKTSALRSIKKIVLNKSMVR